MELLVIGLIVLIGVGLVAGTIALALRASAGPKNCPHCGKPLR
jgi:hypothetical protein